MSQIRRRRALRSSVLAASVAVLASFVVAPPASAEDASPTPSTTTSAPTPGSADSAGASPTADPTQAEPTAPAPTTPAPTTSAPTTGTGPTAADPSPAADVLTDPPAPSPGDTVVGELQQAWPDPSAEFQEHEGPEHGDDDHAGETPLSWIDTGDGNAVRVPTEALPDVAVGSTIAVTFGEQVTDQASAEQGFAPAVDVRAATVLDAAAPDPTTAAAGSSPTNSVTAVLVLPAGATADGMTISTVVSTLNGDVSSFWDEQSNGTVRIAAVQGATGWVSSAQACSSPFALWNDVARQIGWTEGAGKHLMLYVPRNAPGCAYGLGTVGSSIGSGGYSYVEGSRLSVMGHELGHNFGLGHSSELQCDSSLEAGTCRTRDYYDFYDIMGISWDQVGTLNVAQAARLGFLPASEQVALTPASAPTTVTLVPVSAGSGTRAVKLTAGDGTVYYLEYRQAGGRDAWLGDGRNVYGLTSGVVLRRTSAGANTSLLLDGSPSPTSGWDGDLQQSLPVGLVTQVAGDGFSATTVRTDASGAEIRIVPAAAMGPIATSTVPSGRSLAAGDVLYSPNGAYRLTVQGDGNVVVYGPGNAVVWASGTSGTDARLVVQTDGNLVLYGSGAQVLWNSETGGNDGVRLVLQSDGNLVLYAGDNSPVWWPSKRPTTLSPGRQLVGSQSLVSPSGAYRLLVQTDGNAVVYGPRGAVWSARTAGAGARLVMQTDGNLVLYRGDGLPLWNSSTGGRAGARLVLQDDGNLVVYSAAGSPVWWIGR